MSEQGKIGVMLINLGTPDDLSVSSVRRYLREFLLDPRVIDLPTPLRWLLVHAAILPFRPFATRKAYQKIWRQDGSPLRLYSLALSDKVSQFLDDGYQVEMAMRYGKPSIQQALKKLSHCRQLIILPLFPQYSSAATGSAIAKTLTELSKAWNIAQLTVVDKFYDTAAFLHASSEIIRPFVTDSDTFLLLSYHGLPERHLDKSACKAACQRKRACPMIGDANYFCYRAQCYHTSQLLAERLALTPQRFMTSFQSRLGRIPWIKPYTDEVLPQLRARGIKKLAVACPAFVADCLETLEEIGMQAKAQWQELGGESFELIPCLNDNEQWAEGLAKMIDSYQK